MPSFALPRIAAQNDVLIAGGGIIGLSTALELHARGARVTVIERDAVMAQASTAAAGMLAAHDPHNPPELQQLSDFSISKYPAFLERIQRLSGIQVPFQTEKTHQYLSDGTFITLDEHSIDPRQLAAALVTAVRATAIQLLEHSTLLHVRPDTAVISKGELPFDKLIIATGAWGLGSSVIAPRKGQMLRVRIPPGLDLHEVHRSEGVYVVPRTIGPQQGTALIGATVEDAGFDTSTDASHLAALRAAAARFVPELASLQSAPQIEAWAGLRPATPDLLPVLGLAGNSFGENCYMASGHFRNGILLAPATAAVMADLLEGKPPGVDLSPFSPLRNSLRSTAHAHR